jgi:hypothetical protein
VLKEDFMLFDLEELYMLRNNLKSYGQQIQLMFKNKQTNKINEAKRKQNQKPHKQKQMKKTRVNSKNTTYVGVHPGPSKELASKYSGLNRVK